MNALPAACAAASLALGALLIVRGAVGVTPPLSSFVDDLHRVRETGPAKSASQRWVAQLAGRSTPEREVDLAVCGRSAEWFVQQRCIWAALWALPGLALLALSSWGVASFFPAPLLLVASGAGLIAGWFYALIDLRSDAEKARREFRHSLASYLELVTILMSGGAGVETAMFDAAALGKGQAFQQIRSALAAAHAHRQPPWHGFGRLGAQIGVTDLEQLEASMTLAGGGAQVRDSLGAKAASIRMKDLGAIESEAQARSETMVLPVALMFAGFLVLIGYPALAALSGP